MQSELLNILEGIVRPKRLTIDSARNQLKILDFQTEEDAVTIIREDRDGR